MKSLAFIYVSFLCSLGLFGQDDFDAKARGDKGIRVVFYNTENFFDMRDDPNKRDDEFTPSGDKHWDQWKYREKTSNLAKVITAVGGWEAPEIVAFCELENADVLQTLIFEKLLIDKKYKIVHYESPDRRGIDVGLIYRTDKINIVHSEPIAIHFPWSENNKTRDILYTTFTSNIADTIHFFVNHWPSRWGGQLESEPGRKFVASVLKSKVDSIQHALPNAKILIVGDFNDTPVNESLTLVLEAKKDTTSTNSTDLINLMYAYEGITGTHKYQGQWGVLDQIIVSKSFFISHHGWTIKDGKGRIFNAPFLLEPDEKYHGNTVSRTYQGMKYIGGYSDHLPIYIDLLKE